jgi:hypothetical protein
MASGLKCLWHGKLRYQVDHTGPTGSGGLGWAWAPTELRQASQSSLAQNVLDVLLFEMISDVLLWRWRPAAAGPRVSTSDALYGLGKTDLAGRKSHFTLDTSVAFSWLQPRPAAPAGERTSQSRQRQRDAAFTILSARTDRRLEHGHHATGPHR